MSYSFDTGIIISLKQSFPRDVHPGIWEALESLIEEGRGVMAREAHEELKRVDDVCAPWARDQRGFVQTVTDRQVAIVGQIADAYPGWVDERSNEADPWVIAVAEEQGRAVVTTERRKGPGFLPANLKIPNVCSDRGVESMDLNALARAEGWVFRRV